ncbi:collectin-10 [Thalassophryne amazonica]|uniref:collectin-10 n=1 Tax=Thalassophryne amazonica TaxID=390379 RepID=UPI001470B774|nr:collectin-10 [Thalassophryne amazonica]
MMAGRRNVGLLVLFLLAAAFTDLCSSTEICTNSFLPGAKGDQGETGDEGDQGIDGKKGPPGLPGQPGETGLKGDVGHVGKMGPTGEKGDQGETGLDGPPGLKGKPGATCDCSRYRKVVGQLDVSVGKLRKAVKFVKNVILGLMETEQRYYLLVKEARRFREASVNCKLRGGTLVMPKTGNINQLLADHVSQAGLSRVFIGIQALDKDTDGSSRHAYTDSSPLQGFAVWSQDELLNPNMNASCVVLLSSGSWGHVECDTSMFYICEFSKIQTRGGG